MAKRKDYRQKSNVIEWGLRCKDETMWGNSGYQSVVDFILVKQTMYSKYINMAKHKGKVVMVPTMTGLHRHIPSEAD